MPCVALPDMLHITGYVLLDIKVRTSAANDSYSRRIYPNDSFKKSLLVDKFVYCGQKCVEAACVAVFWPLL